MRSTFFTNVANLKNKEKDLSAFVNTATKLRFL
jgi:hypothetical protein